MIRLLKFFTGILFAALLTLGAWADNAGLGDQLSVAAETIGSTGNEGMSDVQFHIHVANGESSTASNVSVTFDDGYQVSMGDVAAGASANSGPHTRLISPLSMNHPEPVTVTFWLDGVMFESAATLILRIGDSAEGGQ